MQDTAKKGGSDQPLEGTQVLRMTNIRIVVNHVVYYIHVNSNHILQAHSNAIFDIAWMPQESKLITASGDHTARLWDVSSSEIREVQCFHAHSRSIKSAVFRHQDKGGL